VPQASVREPVQVLFAVDFPAEAFAPVAVSAVMVVEEFAAVVREQALAVFPACFPVAAVPAQGREA